MVININYFGISIFDVTFGPTTNKNGIFVSIKKEF